MYPCYCDPALADIPELIAFHADCEEQGLIADEKNWYITDVVANKFKKHLDTLLVIAEQGNPFAQYFTAVIYMLGYCYSSEEECRKNYECDTIEATKWLIRAARQGFVAAIDNLMTNGTGPEVERLRKIYVELDEEIKNGASFPAGETWRRAYGNAIPENPDLC